MGGLIFQILVPVVLTHGFRRVGRSLGPRRGGLIMGLPTTSAVVLYTYGCDKGAGEALGVAESGLLGLVAAALTPLVYAHSLQSGWGIPRAAVTAVCGYLAAALFLSGFAGGGPLLVVGVASAGISASIFLASRRGGEGSDGTATAPGSPGGGPSWGTFAARTVVPALMGLLSRFLRDAAGPSAAGMFMTFPATSVALLLATQVESGPNAARGLARAMPTGALGMAAFLTAFLALLPTFGPLVAISLGYLAAVLALGGAEVLGSTSRQSFRPGRSVAVVGRLVRRRFGRFRLHPGGVGFEYPGVFVGVRSRRVTRFAPLVEALAG